MECAPSPFVALLLGDDMWSPRAVGVLRAAIAAHPPVDFFHSARVIVDGRDLPVSPVFDSRDRFEPDDFRWGSPVKHLLCWRRELGLAVGGLDESLGAIGVDDYDFPWTMAEAGASFRAVHECLYYYRNHCDSYRLTTHTPRSVLTREIATILKKHGVGPLARLLILVRLRGGSLGEQCLYRSRLTRWVAVRLGRDPRRRWRQPRYRERGGAAVGRGAG
jgi:GT2 family glycosyltransferase